MRALLPVCALAAGLAVAQQTTPYRGTADLVSIYATVTDESGRLVPDLTRDDFVVKDNGRKQTLAIFSNEVQPISVVVMLDCSPSMAGHTDTVRDGAVEFVKQLSADDRMRLGTFGTEIQLTPEAFTNERAPILASLGAGLATSSGSPIWTSIDRSITALLEEGGRRVVLVFTDGENAPQRGQVVTDLKDVIWRARYDDVMVYTIGFVSEGVAWPGLQQPHSAVRGQTPQEAARKALRDLAAETGGGYFEMDALDNLSATFARVAEELHHQYWIGFTPAALDDKMHKLEVSVRRQGVTVQARKSYFAGSFIK
jgi:Ca-activated chloride channel family protein